MCLFPGSKYEALNTMACYAVRMSILTILLSGSEGCMFAGYLKMISNKIYSVLTDTARHRLVSPKGRCGVSNFSACRWPSGPPVNGRLGPVLGPSAGQDGRVPVSVLALLHHRAVLFLFMSLVNKCRLSRSSRSTKQALSPTLTNKALRDCHFGFIAECSEHVTELLKQLFGGLN